ncbi:MAG: adenosylhomocysteine nucleosidase [Gammaproteobacteria bacterium]|jgi:adenosylhomocysteine nucleosidase
MPLRINIVVALPSEARPIIEHLSLRHERTNGGMKFYRCENISLVVSGVGKTASAMAVGFLAALADSEDRHIWLNVGIAGHATLPIGTLIIAHTVTDHATGRSLYPSIVFNLPCQSHPVRCFDQPSMDYPFNAICDMESAAFYAAASRITEVEFTQILKIVSDNSESDIRALDRDKIVSLVEENLGALDATLAALVILDKKHRPEPPRPALDQLTSRWHFTVTQQAQLRDAARRWALLRPQNSWPPMDELRTCGKARDVLSHLVNMLATERIRVNSGFRR